MSGTSEHQVNSELLNSHQFVQLKHGRCHYHFEGPENGPLVLMLHGATVPAWELDRIVPFLNRAGFRTLQLDLFGHGYSARPRVPHDYDLFSEQVLNLLDVLAVRETVHVLGHSLGAVLAGRLAIREPERFGVLILAAPMLDYLANDQSARWLKIPWLGEILIPSLVVPMLVRRRTRRYRPIEDGRFAQWYRAQVRLPGFGRSLLSLIRTGALGDQRALYEALNDIQNPLLMVRGADDVILPAQQMSMITQLVPRATVQEISNTAHAMLLTDPELVAPYLLNFLFKHIAPDSKVNWNQQSKVREQ
jgi:pimeloyl-ACP methyl ester carboxylesterase